jgi:hypothetical protein
MEIEAEALKPILEGLKCRKILVTGLGRSGTSSVSSMLYHAGFNVCGDAEPNEAFEDEFLRPLLVAERFERIEKELQARLRKHQLVAWKDPKLYDKHGIKFVRRLSDDWTVIVVFRDPVAIVSRRVATDKVEFSADMQHVAYFIRKLHDFAAEMEKTKKVIYVSYEKVMTEPIASIQGIFEKLGAEVPAEAASQIWSQMQRSQKAYLAHPSVLGKGNTPLDGG